MALLSVHWERGFGGSSTIHFSSVHKIVEVHWAKVVSLTSRRMRRYALTTQQEYWSIGGKEIFGNLCPRVLQSQLSKSDIKLGALP